MKLFLVQHAQAKSQEEDMERSLSDQGRENIEKMAVFLQKTKLITLNQIFHSGKTRAFQSAEKLAEYLHPANGIHLGDGLEPKAAPEIWWNKLKETQEDTMIVGHLPHLSRLVSLLLNSEVKYETGEKGYVQFQNAGCLCLQRDEKRQWKILWMIIPEMLK